MPCFFLICHGALNTLAASLQLKTARVSEVCNVRDARMRFVVA